MKKNTDQITSDRHKRAVASAYLSAIWGNTALLQGASPWANTLLIERGLYIPKDTRTDIPYRTRNKQRFSLSIN